MVMKPVQIQGRSRRARICSVLCGTRKKPHTHFVLIFDSPKEPCDKKALEGSTGIATISGKTHLSMTIRARSFCTDSELKITEMTAPLSQYFWRIIRKKGDPRNILCIFPGKRKLPDGYQVLASKRTWFEPVLFCWRDAQARSRGIDTIPHFGTKTTM